MGRASGWRTTTIASTLLLLFLGACVPDNNQAGLLRTPEGGIEILYVRCVDRNEAVRTVRLRDDSGDVLWRVVDTRAISERIAEPRLLRFELGQAPPGFVEEVRLDTELSESETYHLGIGGLHVEGFPYVRFTLDDLSEHVVYGGIEAPIDDFVTRASDACDRPEPPFGGFFAGRVGGLRLILATAVVGLASFAVQRFGFRRKRARSSEGESA